MNQTGGTTSDSESDMETETAKQNPQKKTDTVPEYELHSSGIPQKEVTQDISATSEMLFSIGSISDMTSEDYSWMKTVVK